jgi:hypothetical protein
MKHPSVCSTKESTLWFIKTKRGRVFDAGGPFLGRQRFAWRGLRRYERPGNERESSTAKIRA